MQKRRLGKTDLMVSEIGFGGEWLERHPEAHSIELIRYAEKQGINIIDCWMPDPKSRDIIGKALQGSRENWVIQGHVGSTWQNGQYVRTRDMKFVKPAFEDLLHRLQTDYVDLGMIHYVDSREDWDNLMTNGFIDYVKELKAAGTIRHIGLSSHNPQIAKLAVESGLVEMILFSINPAFDMQPSMEHVAQILQAGYQWDLRGIDPDRLELYRLCEQRDIGITVMKGFAGGRLLDEKRSPFGIAMTPAQCIHYCLTRPAVAAIMVGYDTVEQIDAAVGYETAADREKDYAAVIANAPARSCTGECAYCGHCKPCVRNLDIAMINKFYDLAVLQPEVPATVQAHYEALEHTASECIGCRACEERCPFSVPIAERMQKAAELFGL